MPRKKKDYHYIYKTTCKVNGKYYIGMHSTDDLSDGYIGSGKRLWNAIKKYGKENFEVEFLEFFENRKDLINREIEMITEDLLHDPMCMNLSLGGNGGWDFVNDNKLNGFCLPGVATKARLITNKILHERLQTDLQYRERVCKSISIGLKKTIAVNGHNWTGKSHKEDTKNKIGKANSKKQLGSKNSQYGTCWITKDNTNKKIKKEDLPSYIQDGWIKGRV